MEPRIELLQGKNLVGQHMRMSFAHHNPRQLWQGFMPRRKEIKNTIDNKLYSLEVYDADFFQNFNLANEFEKWAAVEVTGYDSIPNHMEGLIVPAGLYAVFLHKGSSGNAAKIYDYIFRTWLPASEYALDHRPHFAVMDERYKKDDVTSEEEIWIPVKSKSNRA